MTLLSLKQAGRRPNRTFPSSHYTPCAILLQIKANNGPFPWQDRVHTAGTAERDRLNCALYVQVLGH